MKRDTAMASDVLVRADGLHKAFGAVQAVDNVSLSIPAGEIYGLVGSDGAGKTTTMRLLVGALLPSSGEASGCGFNLTRQAEPARACLGYLSQRFSLYEDLTVLENIRFFAEARGLQPDEWRPRSLEILDFVGLARFRDRRAGQLSGGMKQKLGLATALVARPRVLLLDEPTTGVDPVTRQDFWQLLIQLATRATEKVAILISTPYMDEAARCHRIGFMQNGRIITEGTPGQLRGLLEQRVLELCGQPLPLLNSLSRAVPGVEDVKAFGDRLHLRIASGQTEGVTADLERAVAGGGGQFISARPIPPSLEDVFMYLSETAHA